MEHQTRIAREGRFSSPIQAVKSFSTDAIYICQLWREWYTRNVALINKAGKVAEIAALAALGIIKEGKLQEKELVAQEMANQFIQCGADHQKIRECAVKLYSKDTFLYKLLNETLRADDRSKVDTLGPFCYLLNAYLSHTVPLTEELTVYRGMTLTDEMIKDYEEVVDSAIDWPAFTSASKNPAVAEMFVGNTLCIITIPAGRFIHGRDISAISNMPDEEEFLFSVSFPMCVKKVEVDPTNKKHLIYLESTLLL